MHAGRVTGLGLGGVFWLAALALTLAASIAFHRESQRTPEEIQEEIEKEEFERPGFIGRLIRTHTVLLIVGCALLFATGRWAFVTVTGDRADARLTRQVTSAMSSIPLPPGSTEIYRELSANHDCKWARVTTVYSVDLGQKQICETMRSGLVSRWSRDDCSEQWVPAAGTSPKFAYQHMQASVEPEHLKLEHTAYGVEATPRFTPINEYIDFEVIRAAHKLGKSFFFVDIQYQEPHGEDRYPCNEADFTCYCASNTFYRSTASTLQ